MQNNFEPTHIKKAKLLLEHNLKIARSLSKKEEPKTTLSWWQKMKRKFLG